MFLSLVLFVTAFTPQAQADPTASREYQVKAAFLYNFMNFVDWPEEKLSDNNEPITIGIIGNNPFGDAFKPIQDKLVKGKKVVIQQFQGLEELKKSSEEHPQIEAIRKCHLLFVCQSEKGSLKKIIDLIKDYSVLTVGDMEGFLESGGIINFVMEENKVRFEIDIAAARRAKLKIRSQLLRLAKRVVGQDTFEQN